MRRDGLAAARLADDAHRLAAVDAEVDAVDRLDEPVIGREIGLEATDLEKRALGRRRSCGTLRRRCRHRRHITRRGSSTSRSPSPMKLMASTVRKIAAPAESAQCGAKSR